tara:strand:- start:1037 stop:2155 length:1119 start_codon:yes stop_codon:yes gene_type:complete
MSKLYLSTDWHFGIYPLNHKKWLKIQLDYFYKQFIPYLIETKKEGDALIMLGDLFDNRTSVSILVQNKVEQLLIDISEVLPVHLIVGNHDLWNKGDNSINSPKLFRHLPNINIYEDTTTISIGGKELVLMPWVEKRDVMLEEIKNNPGDYLFCHSDLNGCRMHLSSIAHRNKFKIDVNAFNDYTKVYSGHIHIRQIQNNFEFIGAPYQMDRNDYHDKKGLTILDLETGETNFIENIISPTFKKVKVKVDGDLLLLDHMNCDKHFVDLEISNSVLMGKRKNRKILEEVLGKKKFASVEYINDLIKVDDSVNENLINIDVDLDDVKVDDFDEVILKYATLQEYNDDTHKKGTLSELNKILKVYKKEYKFKGDEE